MTVTPLQFVHAGVDLVTDADLVVLYPRILVERWAGYSTYRVQLVEAFNQLLRDLVMSGYADASLIEDSAANQAYAKQATRELALARIFRTMIAESGDRWDILCKHHQGEYTRILGAADLDYDTNSSGSTSDDESVAHPVEFVR